MGWKIRMKNCPGVKIWVEVCFVFVFVFLLHFANGSTNPTDGVLCCPSCTGGCSLHLQPTQLSRALTSSSLCWKRGMAEIDDSVFFDIEHILNEEELAELWFEEEEEMQDAGIWEYNSEDEMQDGNQEEQQQQPQTETNVLNTQMQQQGHEGTGLVCRKQLTLQQRRKMIVDAILLKMSNGTLPRGHMKQLASEFNVHKSTITRIFSDIKKQLATGDLIDVRTKKFGKTGRKPMEISDETLQSVPLHLRQTERSYAGALKISLTTVHNLKKRGRLRTHTCCNKPLLTSDHKVVRLRWILSHINPVRGNEDPTFVDMRNVIHCDEKWFYLNPDKMRFYLLPSEEDPYMAV